MGQSHPQDNRRQVKGGIFIKLDQTAFVSKQVIHGLLNVNLEEPFQGHILQITLTGLEETHFTYRVSSGKRSRTVHARGMNYFLNFSIPVYDFAQGSNNPAFVMQPCQVVIPFQIMIADMLPSSMKYFYNQHNQCAVKYSLVASIIPTEANVKPIIGMQDIFIGQQIPSLELPNTTTSSQMPEVGCCCTCKAGSISYNVTTSSRSYAPNEIIPVKLDVDFSQYTNKVKSLNVKLIGSLCMKADNSVRQRNIQMFEKSVNVPVDGAKLQKEVQIQVPSDISLSSQGKLIKLEYTLRVYPEIDTCCCISDYTPHSVVIYINPQSNQNQGFNYQGIPAQLQVQAPQNWNPVQLQPTQFSKEQTTYIQQQQNQYQQQEQQFQMLANPMIQPYQQNPGYAQRDQINNQGQTMGQPIMGQPMMGNQNQYL